MSRCNHGMARPEVADGADVLQIWKVAVNLLNKQSLTVGNVWPSSLGIRRMANNSPP